MWPWLLVALTSGGPATGGPATEPTQQTLVYYNARMALREGDALEALKLWYLRNAWESTSGRVSVHDPDFHSVTWAALGEMGICPDGYPTDESGAGLWPLALHNWVVANLSRKSFPKIPNSFEAFDVGRQQRGVSVHDVLSAEELSSLKLVRTRCFRPTLALLDAGEPITADLTDRAVAARLVRHLLTVSQSSLARDRVRGRAAIEARLFDVDLQLTELARRAATLEARRKAVRSRELGLSKGAVDDMLEDAPAYTFAPTSEQARILRASVTWPASEWMTLSPERRLFLFEHARTFGGDPQALDAIAVGVVDALIDERRGEELEDWIAVRATADDEIAVREVLWGGTRGERLLSLDLESGFQERSVVALHRGVHFLEGGDLPGALRSFAFALQHAPESRVADTVRNLSRRWLSFVASEFEVTDELLAMLQALTPREDYAILLEDLLWHAALHADRGSFDQCVRHQTGRGALAERIDLMRPLAKGDIGVFSSRMREGLSLSPSVTLRFLEQFVERLEAEDGDVRLAHTKTLRNLHDLLVPLTPEEGKKGGQARVAATLLERTQAMLGGLPSLGGPEASARDEARTLSPRSDVFAGSIRLAPADPLPWPFVVPKVTAPSIFEPIELEPLEWRSPSGDLVFGWRMSG